MECTIRLAETVIQITNTSEYMERLLRNYKTESDEIQVTIDESQLDIEAEREYYRQRNGTDRNANEESFASLAIYREIAEQMIGRNTLLFHGSVICKDGNAYMFCADSGTGKSTHTRMWREVYGDQVFMINDDKPLIRFDKDIRAYGTPWSGKHHLDTNTSAPLKGICMLSRDVVNHIERITEGEALPHLLRYCYRSKSPIGITKTLELLYTMTKTVPVYTLGCNISHEAAVIACEGMQNI